MKKTNLLIMAALLGLGCTTSCKSTKDSEPEIIERPEINVVDGKFTPELMESFGRVSDPVVSPDKKKVLYGVQYESLKLDKGNRELWVMNVDGSNQTKITRTAESEQGAVWLNGGKNIAFMAKDGKNMQIFVMNSDGTNRKAITNLENGVEGFLFSPDEKNLLIVSTVKWRETASDIYPDLDKTSGRIITDLMYKHWDEWTERIPHPFLAEYKEGIVIDDKTVTDIMKDEPFEAPMRPFGGIESFAWSPDNSKLIYVSRKKEGMEYALSTNSDLYEYNLADKTTRNITEGMMGYDTCPVYSPDGQYVAWLSMEHDGYESDKNRIFIMNVKTTEKKDITSEWDYSADQIAWKDNENLYLIAAHQGTSPIFTININSKEIKAITDGLYDYTSLAPVDETRVISCRHSMLAPNEVVLVENGKEAKEITQVNAELLGKLDTVTIEKHMVKTTDGKEMLTWVVLPPKFDANKKYPAILYCQGGPQQAVSQFWSYRWNLRLMASQGYVVIAPNRRGLPGFGTEWNAQISGDYGGQNMKDYLSAVDYMKEKPYIDVDHIGATGASYGGFSVYWLAGNHDNRFAALIAHAGIFNTESQYLETEEMWFANWDLGGAFWDKSNAVAQRSFANSPHKFVDKWNTPIMITVGEKDYRILASQGMMAFNAAKLRNIPTRMIVYPDENHWILKPQNALLWQREFFAWFDKWLKPQENAK